MQHRAPRIQSNLLVNKHVDGVPYLSIVSDISLSGIALKTPIEPCHRPNAKVLIEMVFPDGLQSVWLSALPIRDGLHGRAVYAFDKMRLPVRRALERFLGSDKPPVDSSRVVIDS